MNPKTVSPEKIVHGYLQLAHGDYLASRHMLISGFLEHGAMLASTAVEKYLKAVIGVYGINSAEHLGGKLYGLLKANQPVLSAQLDMDFIKFLEKAYRLRCAIVSAPGLAIVINQYRTLMALDVLIAHIDSGFKPVNAGEILKTVYRNDIDRKNIRLLEANAATDESKASEILLRENNVLELKIEKNFQNISVAYVTQGVNTTGSFLKIPELGFGKQTFNLTKG